MGMKAPRPAALITAVLFALSCFGLTLFIWISFGGAVPFRAQGYRFHARFLQAAQLSPNADVRIAGVTVGKVVKVTPDFGRTEAVIQLERKYAPLRANAHAILRTKT